MKKPFKIPTIVGLLMVLLLVAGIAVVTQLFLRNPTEADTGKIPKDVNITNITDSGFTVTWRTEKPTIGVVQVKDDAGLEKPQTFFDERSMAGDVGNFTMHSVPVRNSKPKTNYHISILGKSDAQVSQDQSYPVTTAPSIASGSNTVGPAYGRIVAADETAANGALVFLTFGNSQTLSAIVKPSGSFLIPLNLIRTADLSGYMTPDNNTSSISITASLDTQQATVITDVADDAPVPDVMLGKTYDFRGKAQQSKRPTEVAKVPSFTNILGSETQSSSASGFHVSITSPEQGAHIISAYPFITGTGFPNTFISITLGMIAPQTASAKVAQDGTWTFTPKKPVGIGNQSVTITTIDGTKKPVAITHLFEIMKSGTQVLGIATPSGTIAPTSIPLATIIPTSIPTTPTETPPVTATTAPTTILTVISILFTLGGVIAFVL